MSTLHHASSADASGWECREVSDFRWAIGVRTNRVGDYLLKLGDRLCGDKPMGVAAIYELGHAMGKRKSGEAIDMDEIFSKAAKA